MKRILPRDGCGLISQTIQMIEVHLRTDEGADEGADAGLPRLYFSAGTIARGLHPVSGIS